MLICREAWGSWGPGRARALLLRRLVGTCGVSAVLGVEVPLVAIALVDKRSRGTGRDNPLRALRSRYVRDTFAILDSSLRSLRSLLAALTLADSTAPEPGSTTPWHPCCPARRPARTDRRRAPSGPVGRVCCPEVSDEGRRAKRGSARQREAAEFRELRRGRRALAKPFPHIHLWTIPGP